MSSATAIAFTRKRKDVEVEDDFEPIYERRSGIKGLRRGINLTDSTQEAQFHPLPQDLNLQLLANMGYSTNHQQYTDYQKESVKRRFLNHSPSSSSTSDFCPSTPADNMASSVESYFNKGIQSETSNPASSYPNFDIYPDYIAPRPPGLLGMQMTQSKSAQSFDSDADGMDVDGEQPLPVHGDHCKSIPQLLCRGSGPRKELWAQCRDCGSMDLVDNYVPDALCYSP